ncbi:unnamed protein product [Kuraishia capsulata CBS 1993]|uniref:DNA repair and recombination protein RAD52 n=1 Tax=Kuraishia capsulata CBS 1993 TaxID=1382522 RepID=W6MRH6_9ASCO|nr:uncharacterized protein KUCA_T00005302001 [Kuraishia capsulata CBS 1993]CDK29314.1 unnamed protein product [Kuraishia capsulata CBS 1993]
MRSQRRILNALPHLDNNATRKKYKARMNAKKELDSVQVPIPYAPEERERISAELDKQLGPEYVATRPGQGGAKVSYIEGWKAINLANRVFGFDNWNSEVRQTTVDYVEETGGRFSVGLSTVVRVTLKNGSFHEDIGYGHIENARTRAMAFEKCKKEAMTDGLKRALRCFGNAMGNCLYDKAYLARISKVKTNPQIFDENNLVRPAGRPDGRLDGRPMVKPQNIAPAPHAISAPAVARIQALAPANVNDNNVAINSSKRETESKTALEAVITEEDFDDSFGEIPESEDFMNGIDDYEMTLLLNKAADDKKNIEVKTEPQPKVSDTSARVNSPTPNEISQRQMETPTSKGIPATVGFFSARAAEEVQNNVVLGDDKRFNPSFISPSIRRTVDPTKSMPVKRSVLQPSEPNTSHSSPSSSLKRTVGMPPASLSKRVHKD